VTASMAHVAGSGHGHPIQPSVGADYPVLTIGEGVWVTDDRGRRYLDAVAGVGVVSLGYGREDIAAALHEQARRLPYSHSMRFANEPQRRLAERLAELTPDGLNWFFFCSGGSEALDSALKITRQYWLDRGQPDRSLIIGRRPSFHGNTLAALSAGYHAARRQAYVPYLLDFRHIDAPWVFHCKQHAPDGPYCSACSGAALEEAIVAAGPNTVAAFIAEPIVGAAAPAVTPPAGYYETIRAICDRYDVLFIADEVMTGVGRTGRDFGIQYWDAGPDLMLIAKGIASGYASLAAVAVHERLVKVVRGGGGRIEHNFTMAGNPLACAVGDAVLTAYEAEGVLGNVERQGERLMTGLLKLKRHPLVGDVRGRGLMAAIELTVPGTDSALPAPLGAAARLDQLARDEGLIVYPCSRIIDGLQGDAILLLPPLVISEAEVNELLERLDRALTRLNEELVPALS
jgi:adenosylmethionine-8-amino-7-oxononanoate aminotransferase